MKRFSWSNWIKYKESKRSHFKQAIDLTKEKVEKIKNHHKTKVITYKDQKKAFDYVDKLFPNVNVKDVVVYQCDRKYLKRIKMGGIGGFYSRFSQVVVVSDDLDFGNESKGNSETWGSINVKFETDDVIVHELLHYVSLYDKESVSSEKIEEEFAYGNSIAYLKSKGFDDESIINNVFLPYLMGAVDRRKIFKDVLTENGYSVSEIMARSVDYQNKLSKKLEKPLFDKTKEKAIEMGRDIIRIYEGQIEFDISNIEIEDDSFGMIDFSL